VVTGLLVAGGMLVVAFIMHEARAEYPLIHLSVPGPISQWRLS
jgi:hypothetical protein